LKIGYARVSGERQMLDLQLQALEREGVEKVFLEKASGAQRDRPELMKALEYLREGDTLIVWKLDRLGRSLRQLLDTVETLNSRGIDFRSITERLETGSPGGRLTFHVFGALAEWERSVIRERTLAGLAAAKEKGRLGGRPRALSSADLTAAKALLADSEITVKQVAERLGVSAPTLYRYLPSARAMVMQE
jgi:DNA invertase Pin-like site-specific DNA recombinase